MKITKETQLDSLKKSDFNDYDTYSGIEFLASSSDLEHIKKAFNLVKKAVSFYESSNLKKDEKNLILYLKLVANKICSSEHLNSDLFNELYSFYDNNLKKDKYGSDTNFLYNLFKNPNFPEELKFKFLEDSSDIYGKPFIVSGLASNPNNSPEVLNEIYNNHQCDYVEFRFGMGHSFINRAIAENPMTPNDLKLKIINELPDIVSEKSKELSNMSDHDYFFDTIYKHLAYNPTNSEEIFTSLFEAKNKFKTLHPYYLISVASLTKNPSLLDRIMKDENLTHNIANEITRNKNISSDTIDYILNDEKKFYEAKNLLCLNPSLNEEQFIKSLEFSTSWHKDTVKDYILEHPSFSKKAGEKLLEIYGSNSHYSDKVALVKDKLGEMYLEDGIKDRNQDSSYLNKIVESSLPEDTNILNDSSKQSASKKIRQR